MDEMLWMAIRQALIIVLGAIEEYLGMERSIVPRRKRGERGTDQEKPRGCS